MMTGAERQLAYRQRKRDAGYRVLHGRLTLEPRVNRQAGDPPPHGTPRRYNSARFPCRCPECTAAVLEYLYMWRAANPDKVREQQRRYYTKKRATS